MSVNALEPAPHTSTGSSATGVMWARMTQTRAKRERAVAAANSQKPQPARVRSCTYVHMVKRGRKND